MPILGRLEGLSGHLVVLIGYKHSQDEDHGAIACQTSFSFL